MTPQTPILSNGGVTPSLPSGLPLNPQGPVAMCCSVLQCVIMDRRASTHTLKPTLSLGPVAMLLDTITGC